MRKPDAGRDALAKRAPAYGVATDDLCGGCGRPYSDPLPASKCFRSDSHACGKRHGGGLERCGLTRRECKTLTANERADRLNVEPSRLALAANDVVKAIHYRHRSSGSFPQWLLLEEFQVGARRCDVWAMNLWTQARGLQAVAYEVKVDRRDLTLELRDPSKRAPAMEASTMFYFACPTGLMQAQEVPEGCGLLEVELRRDGTYDLSETVTAPVRDAYLEPWGLVEALGQRLAKATRSKGMS